MSTNKNYRVVAILSNGDKILDSVPSIKEDYTLKEAESLREELSALTPPDESYHVEKWNGQAWEEVHSQKAKKDTLMPPYQKAQWLFETYGHKAVPMVHDCESSFNVKESDKSGESKQYWQEVMQHLKKLI